MAESCHFWGMQIRIQFLDLLPNRFVGFVECRVTGNLWARNLGFEAGWPYLCLHCFPEKTLGKYLLTVTGSFWILTQLKIIPKFCATYTAYLKIRNAVTNVIACAPVDRLSFGITDWLYSYPTCSPSECFIRHVYLGCVRRRGLHVAGSWHGTLRLLMSYMYGAPIVDVSRSHTTTQHSR
jgi:hypothetical protein